MSSYNKRYAHFGYVLVATMFVCFVTFFSFVACEDKKKEELVQKTAKRKKEIADSIKKEKEYEESKKPYNRVGKYVYVDYYGVIHVKVNCDYINFIANTYGSYTDEDGNEVDASKDIRHGSGVKRIQLKDFNKAMLSNSCHHCIDDDMYEYLKNYKEAPKNFIKSTSPVYVYIRSTKFETSIYYHKRKDCKGLTLENGTTKKINITKADLRLMKPCGICCDKMPIKGVKWSE